MPEFILDHGDMTSARRYRDMDAFTRGYIEALFFTESEMDTVRNATDSRFGKWNPETDSSLPGDVSLADLSESAWQRIKTDCAKFQADNQEDIDQATDDGRINGYDDESAGRDFWYSRNGHGVGYWSRDLEDVGDKLDKAAKDFGECWVELGDDGLIYIS